MLSLHLLILVLAAMALIGSIVIQSFQITPTRHAPKTTASTCDVLVAKSKDIMTVPHQHQSLPTTQQHAFDACCTHSSSNKLSRRSLLKSTHFTVSVLSVLTLSTTATTIIPTTAAYALQPRNEPLCSTGLFENFMEYKCTPIGDIQDEGIGKGFTSVDEQTTNSLMSKLGIDQDTTTTSSSERNVKENETTPTNSKNKNRRKQLD